MNGFWCGDKAFLSVEIIRRQEIRHNHGLSYEYEVSLGRGFIPFLVAEEKLVSNRCVTCQKQLDFTEIADLEEKLLALKKKAGLL